MPSLVDLISAQVLLPLRTVAVLVAELFSLSHRIRHSPAAVQLVLLLRNLLDLLSCLHVLVHIDFSMHAREAIHLLDLAYGTDAATWGEVGLLRKFGLMFL